MSNGCRIRYTNLCVDIGNSFGIIEKIQEGADSAPQRGAVVDAFPKYLNVFWSLGAEILSGNQQARTQEFSMGGNDLQTGPPMPKGPRPQKDTLRPTWLCFSWFEASAFVNAW